jgi:hypothetical protein
LNASRAASSSPFDWKAISNQYTWGDDSTFEITFWPGPIFGLKSFGLGTSQGFPPCGGGLDGIRDGLFRGFAFGDQAPMVLERKILPAPGGFECASAGNYLLI